MRSPRSSTPASRGYRWWLLPFLKKKDVIPSIVFLEALDKEIASLYVLVPNHPGIATRHYEEFKKEGSTG
jgi:hypothetical protein